MIAREFVPETIEMLKAAADLGPCSAGDPRLGAQHRCDLCSRQAFDGHLLESRWVVHAGEAGGRNDPRVPEAVALRCVLTVLALSSLLSRVER